MPALHKIKIYLRGKEFSLPSLDASALTLSKYENRVVEFIREWTSGKQSFEFKTSGSTGEPKHIQFDRSQIVASTNLTQAYFQLKAGYKALLCLDPDFVAGKMMIARALEIGMDLYCVEPTGNPLVHFNEFIDFTALVPYQMDLILSNEVSRNKLNNFKTVILGGSRVNENLIDSIQSLPTRFYETYGMTETLTHIAIRQLNPIREYFKCLPGIKIGVDERSCLNIHVSHLNIKLQTNDVVSIKNEIEFELIGRWDNIINTGSIKISPESLESKIATIGEKSFSGISYFITGLPDSAFGEKVVLVIEQPGLEDQQKKTLLNALKSSLKKWEVPKDILAISPFSRTPSNKINRKETMAKLLKQ